MLLLVAIVGFVLAMIVSGLSEAKRNRSRARNSQRTGIERKQEADRHAMMLETERVKLRGTGKILFLDWEVSFLETHTIRFRRPSPPRATPLGWSTKWDEEQLLRQEGCCFWCGSPLAGLAHRDHVDPLARGGANDVSNLVMACPPCNLDKSASDPRKWIWTSSRISDDRRAVLESMIRLAQPLSFNELTDPQEGLDEVDEVIEFDIIQRSLFDDPI
jgi:hypothetical protein